jgi:hypothetical protein
VQTVVETAVVETVAVIAVVVSVYSLRLSQRRMVPTARRLPFIGFMINAAWLLLSFKYVVGNVDARC